MSDTIVPRTFPYRPSSGWKPEDIWGGPVPGRSDGVTIDGATSETKDRLKMIGISTLEALADAFKSRIAPASQPDRYPGEPTRTVYDPETGLNIPVLRITGAAKPQLSGVTLYLVVGLGVLLLVGIAKESRAAA